MLQMLQQQPPEVSPEMAIVLCLLMIGIYIYYAFAWMTIARNTWGVVLN